MRIRAAVEGCIHILEALRKVVEFFDRYHIYELLMAKGNDADFIEIDVLEDDEGICYILEDFTTCITWYLYDLSRNIGSRIIRAGKVVKFRSYSNASMIFQSMVKIFVGKSTYSMFTKNLLWSSGRTASRFIKKLKSSVNEGEIYDINKIESYFGVGEDGEICILSDDATSLKFGCQYQKGKVIGPKLFFDININKLYRYI